MSIFISSSCRLGSLITPRPYHHLLHHTHNTKEFIQYINYIEGKIEIPHNLKKKVFRRVFMGDMNPNEIRKDILLKEYNESQYIVLEICSQKIYEENGIYLHHLAVGAGDNVSQSELFSDNCKIQSQELLNIDLQSIKAIVGNKQLLIVSHINPFGFEKRQLFIDQLESTCNDLNINFLNLSKLIKPEHVVDANHLKETGHNIVSQAVKDTLQNNYE